jgi:phosphatidylserine decarboxylase
MMKALQIVRAAFAQEDLNFLLTNRIPRMAVTRFMGWFSRIQSPLLCRVSIAAWRLFTDLDLSDSREQRFDSLHACFVRELTPGARPIAHDPGVLVSPCDGILGAYGPIRDGQLFQAKGYPYSVDELFTQSSIPDAWRNGVYATLRITSAMYHRFHSPHDGVMTRVDYIAGDTWNVNPIALRRVEKLFCKNERAVVYLELGCRRLPVALVPVAAILVAGIRLHGIDTLLHQGWRGRTRFDCHVDLRKGDEMGWFEHGSTIIVLAPPGCALADGLAEGAHIRMGQPLMHLP